MVWRWISAAPIQWFTGPVRQTSGRRLTWARREPAPAYWQRDQIMLSAAWIFRPRPNRPRSRSADLGWRPSGFSGATGKPDSNFKTSNAPDHPARFLFWQFTRHRSLNSFNLNPRRVVHAELEQHGVGVDGEIRRHRRRAHHPALEHEFFQRQRVERHRIVG